MSKTKKGCLITFEGPEGSGKSTQSQRLARWLKGRGAQVLLTREPGGTHLGERLRKILLSPARKEVDSFVELCLYEASRAVLVKQVISPALASGRVIILDRFQDSTWVYQGWAGGVPIRWVERLGLLATGGVQPCLTILLDLPPRQGLKRVRHPNRMEAKPLSFHRKVRQGYLALARRHPRRIRVIRADQSPGKVEKQIREVVRHVLC